MSGLGLIGLFVDYPEAYQAFTRNFAYTFGLIDSDSIENTLLGTALDTGGDRADATGAVELSAALLEIENSILAGLGALPAGAVAPSTGLPSIRVDPVTAVRPGLQRYVEGLGIPYAVPFV